MPNAVDLKPWLLKTDHDPTDQMSGDPSKYISGSGIVGDISNTLLGLPQMTISTIITSLTDPTGFNNLVAEFTDFFDGIVGGGALQNQGLWGPMVQQIVGDTEAILGDVGSYFSGLEQMLGLPDFTSGTFDPVAAVNTFINDMLGPTGKVAIMTAGFINSLNIPGLDASKIISGLFSQSMVNNLEADLAAINTDLANAGTDWTALVNAFFAGDTAGVQADFNDLARNLMALLGNPTLNTSTTTFDPVAQVTDFINSVIGPTGLLAQLVGGLLPGTVIPGLDASKITTGFFSQAQITGLTTSLNALLPTTTYQSLVDAIANSLGHTGTGHTWGDIETYFGIIPAANLTGTLSATSIPGLDATKIVSGLFPQSMVNGLEAALASAGADWAAMVQAFVAGDATGTQADFNDLVANLMGMLGSPNLLPGGTFDPLAATTNALETVWTPAGALTSWSEIPANLWSGLSPFNTQNLLPDGGFNNPNFVDGAGVWTWDGTVDHTGVTGSGSVKVTADGNPKELISVPVKVTASQPVTVGTFAKWSGVTAGAGNTIALTVQCYNAADVLINDAVVQAVVTPGATSTGFSGHDQNGAALTATAGWVHLTGTFTTPANTNYVRLSVRVEAVVSAGVVHFDDCLLMIPLIDAALLGNMNNIPEILQESITGLTDLWTNIFGTPSPTPTTNILQQSIDGLTALWNGVFGTPTPTPTTKITPTSIAQALNQGSLSADLQALSQLFFGGHAVGTSVLAAALPNIAAGSGAGQSADLLSHLNSVASAAGATSGTPVDAAAQGMQLITNTLSALNAQVQQTATEQAGATNSGQSFFVYFPAYQSGGWASVPVNTTYGNIPGAGSHGTGTFVINSNGNAAWNAVNNGDVSAVAIYNGAGGQAYTDSVYQKISASLAGLPNGGNAKNFAISRANAITNPSDYVYGVVYLNTSFQLIWELGCYIGGTQHIWGTGQVSTVNLNFTLYAGVGNNPNRYQGYSGSTRVFDHVNVSGDPGGVFPVDLSHCYWGFRSDTFNNGQTIPAPASYVGCADNIPPLIPGVGMRMYRTNTAMVSCPINMDTYGTFNMGNFFDTISEQSNGIRQLTTAIGSANGAGEPIIQVDNAGRYIVSIRSIIAGMTTSSGAVTVCASIIRYNSAGVEQERRVFGAPAFGVNGFGGQYNAGNFGGTEVIGCQAGDFLMAGYYLSSGANATGALGAPFNLTGEVSGARTYFEVTLANWSFQ